MDRRYQVFISSTFQDLIEERKAIMEGLLKIDCLPAGMELFPAADDDQWTLIKDVIDQCDYYLIVSANRYGSVDVDGISYTEKEYDYAVEQGIPVIGFLPKNPGKIESDKSDVDAEAIKKLDAFQEKIKTRMVSFYDSPASLQAEVIVGVSKLQKSRPRPGWVRGDQAMTDETRADIAELRATVARYESDEVKNEALASVEVNRYFAHGDETVEIDLEHSGQDPFTYRSESENGSLIYSWDEIVKLIGPYMIDEATETSLRSRLDSDLQRRIAEDLESDPETWSLFNSSHARISDHSWGTVIVQLRALGLIQTGTKKRTVSDRGIYWRLTAAGDDYLVALRAIPHDPNFKPEVNGS